MKAARKGRPSGSGEFVKMPEATKTLTLTLVYAKARFQLRDGRWRGCDPELNLS
jgi:hypothetical protein